MWARTRHGQRRRLNGRHLGGSNNHSILKNHFGRAKAKAAIQKKVRFHLSNGLVTARLSENSPQPPTPVATNPPAMQSKLARSHPVMGPKPVKVQPDSLLLPQPKPGQKPKSQSVTVPKPVQAPLASPLSQGKSSQKPKLQSVTGPKPVHVQPASPMLQPKPGQKPKSQSVTSPKPVQASPASSPLPQPKPGQKPKSQSATGSKPVHVQPASPLPQPKPGQKPKSQSVTGPKPVQASPAIPPRSQSKSGQKPVPPRSQTHVPSTKQRKTPPATLVELLSQPKERPLPIKPPTKPPVEGEHKLNCSSTEPVLKKRKVQQNLPRKKNQKSRKKVSKSSEDYYEVEAILDHRKREGSEEYEYLLKWKGYPHSDNSWVAGSNLNCWTILQEYLLANMHMVGSSSGSKKLVLKPQSGSLNGSGKQVVKPPSKSLNGSGKQVVKPPSKSLNGSGKQVVKPQSGSLNGSGKQVVKPPSKSLNGSGKQVVKPPSKSLNGSGKQVVKREVKRQAESPRETPLPSKEKKKKPPSDFLPSTESITLTCSTLAPSRTCNGSTIRINGLSEKYPRTDFKYPSSGDKKGECLPPPPSLPPLHESLLDSLRDDLSQASSASTDSIFLNESFRLNLESSEGWSSSDEDDHGDTVVSKVLHLLPPPHQQPAQKPNDFGHLEQTVSLPKRRINGFTLCATVESSGIEQKPTLNGSVELSWSQRQSRKRSRSASPPTIPTSSEPRPQPSLVAAPPLLPPPPPPPPTATRAPALHPSSLAIVGLPLTSNLRLTTQKQRKPSESYQDQLLEWQYELNRQRHGRETIIYVENLVDEAPPPKNFTYITSNRYGEGVPNPDHPENMVRLCGCVCYHLGKKCGPRAEHCCPAMAGSTFAYTAAGKIKSTAGTPIFECNSKCSCPIDCANRVVQHGRKIPLCIFRTESRGWGVKTIEPIKANTFVAEYIGEVITTEEAEQRGKKYDEDGETYLFDLDFNDDPAFTIDAAKFGNVAHFFNHSCDPTLIVYSVWIETLDQRLPRIAFFTTRSISAGEELTFDYQMNCREESSRKMGRIPCLCGSENCIGYLY